MKFAKYILGCALVVLGWTMFWYIGDETGHLVQLFMTAGILLMSGAALIGISLP